MRYSLVEIEISRVTRRVQRTGSGHVGYATDSETSQDSGNKELSVSSSRVRADETEDATEKSLTANECRAERKMKQD